MWFIVFLVAPFFLSPTINSIKSWFENDMQNQSKQHAHSRLDLFFVTLGVFDLLDGPQVSTLPSR
jgi:hypothetical protein